MTNKKAKSLEYKEITHEGEESKHKILEQELPSLANVYVVLLEIWGI